MLYRVLKRCIQNGDKGESMREKLDVFYATDRITEAEYNELIAMLAA